MIPSTFYDDLNLLIEDYEHNNNQTPRQLLINPVSFEILQREYNLDLLKLELQLSKELELHELVVISSS